MINDPIADQQKKLPTINNNNHMHDSTDSSIKKGRDIKKKIQRYKSIRVKEYKSTRVQK